MRRKPVLLLFALTILTSTGSVFSSATKSKESKSTTVTPSEYPLLADYAYTAYREKGDIGTKLLCAILTRCPCVATTRFRREPFATENTSIVHQALKTNDHTLLELVGTMLQAAVKNNQHVAGGMSLLPTDIHGAFVEKKYRALWAMAHFSNIYDIFFKGDKEPDLALFLAHEAHKHLMTIAGIGTTFRALCDNARAKNNLSDERFYQALCSACQKQDRDLIAELIAVSDQQNAPWPSSKNSFSRKPEHATLGALPRAAYLGHQRALEALLEVGYPANTQTQEGRHQEYTAQYYACLLSRSEMQKTLELHGAPTVEIPADERKDQLVKCLQHASEKGLLSVVRTCIRCGVDVKGEFGTDFTGIAAKKGHIAILEALHSAGASLTPTLTPGDPRHRNYRALYPFHEAVRGNHTDVVYWLLQHHVPPSQDSSSFWHQPQDIAFNFRHYAVLRVLLPITPLGSGFSQRRTLLHFAAAAGALDVVDTGVSHAKRQENIQPADNTGHTPLSYAAKEGHLAIVERLIRAGGANPNHVTNDGETPLALAAQAGHLSVVKYLLEQGVHESTPLPQSYHDLDPSNDMSDNLNIMTFLPSPMEHAVINRDHEANMKRRKNSRKTSHMPARSALKAGHIDCARAILEARNDYKEKQQFYDGLILKYAVRVGDVVEAEKILSRWQSIPFEQTLLRKVLKIAIETYCLKPSKDTYRIIVKLLEAISRPHNDDQDDANFTYPDSNKHFADLSRGKGMAILVKGNPYGRASKELADVLTVVARAAKKNHPQSAFFPKFFRDEAGKPASCCYLIATTVPLLQQYLASLRKEPTGKTTKKRCATIDSSAQESTQAQTAKTPAPDSSTESVSEQITPTESSMAEEPTTSDATQAPNKGKTMQSSDGAQQQKQTDIAIADALTDILLYRPTGPLLGLSTGHFLEALHTDEALSQVSRLEIAQTLTPELKAAMIKQTLDKLALSETPQEQSSSS